MRSRNTWKRIISWNLTMRIRLQTDSVCRAGSDTVRWCTSEEKGLGTTPAHVASHTAAHVWLTSDGQIPDRAKEQRNRGQVSNVCTYDELARQCDQLKPWMDLSNTLCDVSLISSAYWRQSSIELTSCGKHHCYAAQRQC